MGGGGGGGAFVNGDPIQVIALARLFPQRPCRCTFPQFGQPEPVERSASEIREELDHEAVPRGTKLGCVGDRRGREDP